MRCPDCGHDYPVKPEVVVEKQPCACGLTENVRFGRYIAGVIILIALLFFLDSVYHNFVLQRAIAEHSLKIRIVEYDGRGNVTKEFSR